MHLYINNYKTRFDREATVVISWQLERLNKKNVLKIISQSISWQNIKFINY